MFPSSHHRAAIRFAQNNPTPSYGEAFQQYVDSLPEPQREALVCYISQIPAIQFSNDLDAHVQIQAENSNGARN
jgi:hypothetical protein